MHTRTRTHTHPHTIMIVNVLLADCALHLYTTIYCFFFRRVHIIFNPFADGTLTFLIRSPQFPASAFIVEPGRACLEGRSRLSSYTVFSFRCSQAPPVPFHGSHGPVGGQQTVRNRTTVIATYLRYTHTHTHMYGRGMLVR